jgi:hypothetical protein
MSHVGGYRTSWDIKSTLVFHPGTKLVIGRYDYGTLFGIDEHCKTLATQYGYNLFDQDNIQEHQFKIDLPTNGLIVCYNNGNKDFIPEGVSLEYAQAVQNSLYPTYKK